MTVNPIVSTRKNVPMNSVRYLAMASSLSAVLLQTYSEIAKSLSDELNPAPNVHHCEPQGTSSPSSSSQSSQRSRSPKPLLSQGAAILVLSSVAGCTIITSCAGLLPKPSGRAWQ